MFEFVFSPHMIHGTYDIILVGIFSIHAIERIFYKVRLFNKFDIYVVDLLFEFTLVKTSVCVLFFRLEHLHEIAAVLVGASMNWFRLFKIT